MPGRRPSRSALFAVYGWGSGAGSVGGPDAFGGKSRFVNSAHAGAVVSVYCTKHATWPNIGIKGGLNRDGRRIGGEKMAQASAAGRGTGSGGSSLRVRVQKFGSFLSGMVMPNIGAFIAWGLITALFIPDGWIPNERLAELVDPMILYLLPLLIAYTGGREGRHGGGGGAGGA